MGGGVPLITLMPGFVPVAAIIPLHAVTQLASNGSRALFGWRHIDFSLIAPFAAGALLGAATGGRLFMQLNLDWLPALIGVVILVLTWLPLPGVPGTGRVPLVFLGFYQTAIGMLIGATGPLGAALLSRRKRARDWLVVNTAVYMSSNHLLKIVAFGIMGFSFTPWLDLLLGMSAAVIAGSWLGRACVHTYRKSISSSGFAFW